MIETMEHTDQDELGGHHEPMVPVLKDDGSIDVHQTAFEVWAMLADRSPVKTVATLRKEFDIEVTADAVRKWVQRYNWAEKATDLFHETAPTYFERTRAALVAAGPPAANYLLAVASGEIPGDRNRLVAVNSALDRIGFLPYTRREAESGHTPIARSSGADDWYDLSDDELREIVRGRVLELSS